MLQNLHLQKPKIQCGSKLWQLQVSGYPLQKANWSCPDEHGGKGGELVAWTMSIHGGT